MDLGDQEKEEWEPCREKHKIPQKKEIQRGKHLQSNPHDHRWAF